MYSVNLKRLSRAKPPFDILRFFVKSKLDYNLHSTFPIPPSPNVIITLRTFGPIPNALCPMPFALGLCLIFRPSEFRLPNSNHPPNLLQLLIQPFGRYRDRRFKFLGKNGDLVFFDQPEIVFHSLSLFIGYRWGKFF